MEVTYDFSSAVIKSEPIDDYPDYPALNDLDLEPPEAIFHADFKIEPIDETIDDKPVIPDEPTNLVELEFMNPLLPISGTLIGILSIHCTRT